MRKHLADFFVCPTLLLAVPTTTNGAAGFWEVTPTQSVERLLLKSLVDLGWEAFLTDDTKSIRWERVVVSGHSQGASHAAYLSVARKVRAAVLFSGPQEHPATSGWLGMGPPTLRRAVYAMHEECGDAPADTAAFCYLFPMRMRKNLEAMGLRPGFIGNSSGFVVVDFEPLLMEGRAFHDSTALQTKAPPPVVALWKAVLGEV